MLSLRQQEQWSSQARDRVLEKVVIITMGCCRKPSSSFAREMVKEERSLRGLRTPV